MTPSVKHDKKEAMTKKIIIKRKIRKALKALAVVFIFMNIIAFFHAYKFTHFTDSNIEKTKDVRQLSIGGILKTVFMGIDNPKPRTKLFPPWLYETVTIQSNKRLEGWWIRSASVLQKEADKKGTVIFFHGLSGEKSTMLNRVEVFLQMGYDALIVDFMGAGDSEGVQTTVGFKEAEEVKSCFDFMKQKGESAIYLFGTSMGAAAILKAEHDFQMHPKGIILEYPFGSMYATTAARFHRMNVPAFPMAGLLVFWGGVQNGFWAFGHTPIKYAKAVQCPVLLMYGRKDETVSEAEISEIFTNLQSTKKTMSVYPEAGHETFLKQYRPEWTYDVTLFMNLTR